MATESDFEAVGREDAVNAVRALYDVLRDLTDNDVIDLQDLADSNPDVYHVVTSALTAGADVLAQVFGGRSVK